MKAPSSSRAHAPGLHYALDVGPGIRRKRRGKGFVYLGADGRAITAASTLARIRSLAIPPAWTDVWICPRAQGHIQATGRDAKGRKQYRYHPAWRRHRDEAKFDQLPAFAATLAKVRRKVQADLQRPELDRDKVCAVIVRLLERTLIRVGNEEYARTNDSYGLTTLLDDHVELSRTTVRFAFRGKSGLERRLRLRDPQLARVVKRCQDLPGQTLFQYVGERGRQHKVGSADVNRYLRDICGNDFSAKSFRTWGGSLHAMCHLATLPPPQSEREAKRSIVAAFGEASDLLGNTVTVCKKYYVHPAVLTAFTAGKLSGIRAYPADARCGRVDLSAAEKTLLRVLTDKRSLAAA
jgi:DNA topoisomerase I